MPEQRNHGHFGPAAALACLSGQALAQPCQPAWSNGIGQPGMSGSVHIVGVHDLGGGPALYAGGTFTTAGGVVAQRVARWDGASWTPLGFGLSDGIVYALAVFDDGGGPALYVGGTFTGAGGVPAAGIARWNGSSWAAVGGGVGGSAGDDVYALAAFDDGSGPALYAGGKFSSAGGAAASHIARWSGSAWSPVGGGLAHSISVLTTVECMLVFDDGSGPGLFVGGMFDSVAGTPAGSVARWSASGWSTLGGGIGAFAHVVALTDFDARGGPALYAGHSSGLQRWDGAGWSTPAGAVNGYVNDLAVFDDGSGPALYAGGNFTSAGGVAVGRIARWNGSAWSPLGSGVSDPVIGGAVYTLAQLQGSGPPSLVVGGFFDTAGGLPAGYIAAWAGCAPVICYANCDESTAPPVLNVADFTCFLTRYAAGASYANCDNSTAAPVLNVQDFTCFLQRYAAGCP